MSDYFPTLEQLKKRIAWVNETAAGSVYGDLQTQLLQADTEKGIYLFQCRTTNAMRNVIHTLHGGSVALIADQAMGCVANSMFQEDGHAPTSQLTVNFHRPMMPGEDVLVRVRVINASRRLIHLQAELFAVNNPDKLCASATSVFCRTEKGE